MEPPLPASSAAAATAAAHANYPDSVESSPRSRNTDSWEETLAPHFPGGGKLRLMCSYGGHIMPRPHDKSLRYVGGETRMIVADRQSSLSDLTSRLSKTLLSGKSFTLKYQLPTEDLDSLISVTTDEDLENMIEEYDRISASAVANAAQKSCRLRLFLFPSKPDSASSIGSILENSAKSEDWFLNALNSTTRAFSESASVGCLLGLDDDIAAIAGYDISSAKDVESQLKGVGGNSSKHGAQDIHSVPDSPMLETTSSFGSASSSPSLANLPPIRLRAEDQKPAVSGIEEQFSNMSVGAPLQKQEDGGFMVLSSPPTILTTAPAAPLITVGVPGDYFNRVFSDDERSEQGAPVGSRKPPQLQPQAPPPLPLQSQPKPTGGVDLASPDSVSSEGGVTNPLSRQRPMIYQDPVVQNPSMNSRIPVNPVDQTLSDLNSWAPMQQVLDSGYMLPTQFDQHHQQINPQQQQQQQQQQLPQQFIQAGTHYIHQHPTGAMPIAPYYSIYPPQHQPLHPHQLFYVQARQSPAYNLPVQPSTYSDTAGNIPSSHQQTHPPPSAMISTSAVYPAARNATAPKPETAAGMYRTATGGPQPLVQVPSSQHQPQYVGYSQIHHPSQSRAPAPTAAANANYTYEYADPTHAQIFYAQQFPAQLAAQYQTISSAPMGLPEASSQLPTESMKQQTRTSQPL